MNNVSRRQFLRVAGASGATIVLAGCGPAAEGTGTDSGSETAADAGTTSEFGADGTLRVGMEAAYAPYNWQTGDETDYTIPIENVDGQYADGYDVQIAKIVADALGLEAVAEKLEWDGLIPALQNGQIDCIIAGMTATEEREESVDFSEPYYVGEYGLMVQQGSPYENATSLEDFAGAAVLGQKDTLLDTLIDEIPDVNHLTPVATVPNQISHLLEGTCDAITFDTGNAKGIIDANPTLVAITFEEGKGFSETVPVNVGVAKGQDDVVEQINDALAEIDDDERQEIWDAAVDRQPA